jgi:tetratricopeptide (TPR) repeat protein
MTHVEKAEIERANRRPTSNLDAWDWYWRGFAQYVKYTKSGTEEALACMLKAIDLDKVFALAYSVAAAAYIVRRQNGWMANVPEESAHGIRLARHAIELGQMDEGALCRGGLVLAYLARELDFGAECIRRGLAINSNHAIGWQQSAWLQIYLGNHQLALEHLRIYERLSPRDPRMMQARLQLGYIHVFQGRYEEAAHLAEQISSEFPSYTSGWRLLAISKALAGDVNSANTAAKKALELHPCQTASGLAAMIPLRRAGDVERLKEGYVRAGFPQ